LTSFFIAWEKDKKEQYLMAFFINPGKVCGKRKCEGTFATGFRDLQNMLKPIWHRRQRIENKKA
jgi:hypothetical protein